MIHNYQVQRAWKAFADKMPNKALMITLCKKWYIASIISSEYVNFESYGERILELDDWHNARQTPDSRFLELMETSALKAKEWAEYQNGIENYLQGILDEFNDYYNPSTTDLTINDLINYYNEGGYYYDV